MTKIIKNIALGKDAIKAIAESLGEDPGLTRRIIIDMDYRDVVRVHIEKMTDKSFFDIVANALGTAEIVEREHVEP